MRVRASILIVCALAAATVGAGAFLVKSRAAANNMAWALEAAEDRARLFQDTLRKLAEEEEAESRDKTTAADVLTAWEDLATAGLLGMLEKVESHASKAGVSCEDVALQAGRESGRDVYRITGTGDAWPLAIFLASLENDPGLSLITSMSITAGEVDGLDFDLSLTILSPTWAPKR